MHGHASDAPTHVAEQLTLAAVDPLMGIEAALLA